MARLDAPSGAPPAAINIHFVGAFDLPTTLAWCALVIPALRAAVPQPSSPGRRTSEATHQSRSP